MNLVQMPLPTNTQQGNSQVVRQSHYSEDQDTETLRSPIPEPIRTVIVVGVALYLLGSVAVILSWLFRLD